MKTNIIKICPSFSPQPRLITEHNNTTVSAAPNARFLGVQIDSHLNWKSHIDQILPKLSTAGFVIRQLSYILNPKTLQWHTSPASILSLDVELYSTNSCRVFKLQKSVLSIMSGTGLRASCRGLFKKLDILHVPCQYDAVRNR